MTTLFLQLIKELYVQYNNNMYKSLQPINIVTCDMSQMMRPMFSYLMSLSISSI